MVYLNAVEIGAWVSNYIPNETVYVFIYKFHSCSWSGVRGPGTILSKYAYGLWIMYCVNFVLWRQKKNVLSALLGTAAPPDLFQLLPLVASFMSLMASLVTTSRMQQCFNVLIDICHEFLLLFIVVFCYYYSWFLLLDETHGFTNKIRKFWKRYIEIHFHEMNVHISLQFQWILLPMPQFTINRKKFQVMVWQQTGDTPSAEQWYSSSLWRH